MDFCHTFATWNDCLTMKNRIGEISVWRIVMGMCLLLAVGDAMAEVNPSRISLYGRNYAGRVLNANVARHLRGHGHQGQ